jgi:hypothetical protein
MIWDWVHAHSFKLQSTTAIWRFYRSLQWHHNHNFICLITFTRILPQYKGPQCKNKCDRNAQTNLTQSKQCMIPFYPFPSVQTYNTIQHNTKMYFFIISFSKLHIKLYCTDTSNWRCALVSNTDTCDYIKCHFLKVLSVSTCLCHVCVRAYTRFCFDSTLMQTKGHKQK